MITNANGTQATPEQLGARMVDALLDHGLAAPGYAHPAYHLDTCDVMVVAPGLVWCADVDGSYTIDATDWQAWDLNRAGTAHDAGASLLREVVEMVGPVDHSVAEDVARRVMDRVGDIISASTGVPAGLLLGDAPSGLSTETT